MNKTIKNKLLHFYTDGGSIYEDFARARAKKTSRFRNVVRVCFYFHCAAAVLCIALAAVLHAGLGIIAVAVFEVILATLAFLSVGDMTLIKTMLYCGDILFAAAMFITGALNETKTPFFITGAVSVVAALVALGAFFAAECKMFLEGFSPLAIRREHYTLLPNLSSEVPVDNNHDIPDMPEFSGSESAQTPKVPDAVLPPPRSEFELLADKLKEIFHTSKTEDALNSQSDSQSQTEVPR